MKKQYAINGLLLLAIIMTASIYTGVYNRNNPQPIVEDLSWQDKDYDLSVPVANEDGWYLVFKDDFNGNDLNENIEFGDRYKGDGRVWSYAPHNLRWKANFENMPNKACYWCPEMVEVKDSNLVIHSEYREDHQCDGKCPEVGRFTGGIDSKEYYWDENGKMKSNDLFTQAFGYFECRAKLPNANGLWSAFWLQSNGMGKVGNNGQDGTEIDVFESPFINRSQSVMGHALLWDGYTHTYGKLSDHKEILDQDLYDDYHTYALKWTPEYYVFYVDGEPQWATSDGDVSKVKEFLRLTVEIDAGDKRGPHAQYIGEFSHKKAKPDSDFLVDYVLVLQNEDYEQYIMDDSAYVDQRTDK